MATTKETKEAIVDESIKGTMDDPYWNEPVTVMLPLTRDKQDDVFVGLNGRTLKIQRGEEVEIPRWAYNIIKDSEQMDMLAITRSRKLQKKNL